LPLIVVLVVLLVTGALLVGARLMKTRTTSRPLGTLPVPADPVAAATGLSRGAPAPTAAGLHAALDGLVKATALGPGAAAAVTDVASGRTSYDANGDDAVPPASTTKLVTAAAALTWLGPDAVFNTRTVLVPSRRSGQAATVVLVGGGDPTLAGPHAALLPYPDAPQLTDLATKTVAALRVSGVHTVALDVDDSLFSGPRTAPGWKPTYVTEGDVSPVTALSVDAGRLRPDADPDTPDIRAADPPLTAGRDLAVLLTHAGVHVAGAVRRGPAPRTATPLAAVSSPTVTQLVTRMLQRSDNDVAEALFRQVAIARHQPPTFAGGATAIREWLTRLHVDIRAINLVDGSGLSLRDRLSPRVLTAVLGDVADPRHTTLRPIVGALPVGGFSGTLAGRYRAGARKTTPTAASGLVRAKTGTLTGVSALAGLVVDADGRLLAFAVVADAVPVGGGTAAQTALDRFATRLASCGCR
jgi:D-alanyl-D-alanine carboxypeptidase/D-alanyl-D-alanine-endopeptidase (penicillin-binding protein 4)